MVKVSRIIYTIAAWVFITGVIIQVFLAGMVVVARQMGWETHRSFGHFWGVPLLFMLITAYLGRLPRSIKWLTWALFGVFIIQAEVIIFLRDSVPVLSAFHPGFGSRRFCPGDKACLETQFHGSSLSRGLG